MKGNAKVIAALNEALKEELTAINQYFLHAEMCENWHYKKLAERIRKESIDEMQAANLLVKDGYLLSEDLPAIEKRAAEHWDYAHDSKN